MSEAWIESSPPPIKKDRGGMVLLLTVLVLVVLGLLSWILTGPRLGKRRPEPPEAPFIPKTAIVVLGEKFEIGTPVVLWNDRIGYDAYSTRCRFVDRELPGSAESPPKPGASPYRYGQRSPSGRGAWVQRVKEKGWDLKALQEQVRMFVVHYDAVGTSERCFRALHDIRGLSVQFMLDLDGTIYQTLDAKERAFHAGDVNDISVGVEIANLGVRSGYDKKEFDAWYFAEGDSIVIRPPADARPGRRRIRDFVARPARFEAIEGLVQRSRFLQWDFTDAQYEALAKLAAGLSRVFPRIKLEAPRDSDGSVTTVVLPETRRRSFEGVVGHYHVSADKYDPGPAFDWKRYLAAARAAAKTSR